MRRDSGEHKNLQKSPNHCQHREQHWQLIIRADCFSLTKQNLIVKVRQSQSHSPVLSQETRRGHVASGLAPSKSSSRPGVMETLVDSQRKCAVPEKVKINYFDFNVLKTFLSPTFRCHSSMSRTSFDALRMHNACSVAWSAVCCMQALNTTGTYTVSLQPTGHGMSMAAWWQTHHGSTDGAL